MPDPRRRRLEIRDVVHVYEGKTTLVRIVAGFLRPTSGVVLWDGASVAGPSPARG